jgi:hypothetical protein
VKSSLQCAGIRFRSWSFHAAIHSLATCPACSRAVTLSSISSAVYVPSRGGKHATRWFRSGRPHRFQDNLQARICRRDGSGHWCAPLTPNEGPAVAMAPATSSRYTFMNQQIPASGVPTSATVIATPHADPNWRFATCMAVPGPHFCAGRLPAVAPARLGSTGLAPRPLKSRSGSQPGMKSPDNVSARRRGWGVYVPARASTTKRTTASTTDGSRTILRWPTPATGSRVEPCQALERATLSA